MALFFAQCKGPKEQAPQVAVTSKDAKTLQEVNKYLGEKEQDVLHTYIARQQLSMVQAPTGYYYQLVEQGKGVTIVNGDAVRLYGKVMLIDGTLCYTYSEQHPFDVQVGAHSDMKILNTALLELKEGSKVRFIFPSHMGYGLLGDGDKIPPRSPLVCEFTIVQVAKKNTK